MLKFNLQTLTPLHTGGVNTGQMDRIQETGIIGSLRWWYEALLRGLVGTGLHQDQVCDPTGESDGRCNYEKYDWVCRACDLFGATGWKRRFRLEINGGGGLFLNDQSIRVKAQHGKHGWFFNSPCVHLDQPIQGQIIKLRENMQHTGYDRQPDVLNDLRVVTELINRWGTLGAKSQHGFGVVDLSFDDNQLPDIEAFLRNLPEDASLDSGFPSIGNMFFARLYFKDGIQDDWWEKANLDEAAEHQRQTYRGVRDKDWEWGFGRTGKGEKTYFSVPIAPAVKYKLRFGGVDRNRNVYPYLGPLSLCELFFFGDEKAEKPVKAKINISNAYRQADGKWQFRIWGWFPEQNGLPRGLRAQVMSELHSLVTDSSQHQSFWDGIFGQDVVDLNQSVWREKDATGHRRNTLGCSVTPTNCANFLRCLLPEGEKK